MAHMNLHFIEQEKILLFVFTRFKKLQSLNHQTERVVDRLEISYISWNWCINDFFRRLCQKLLFVQETISLIVLKAMLDSNPS